jgi:hypothetical protein
MSRWADPNPYHVHEFTVSEFVRALETGFVDLQVFGQKNLNQLRYAIHRILSRALHRFRLMNMLKRLLGWETPQVAARTEFGGLPTEPDNDIQPYRPTLLMQPKYVIVVARNAGEK